MKATTIKITLPTGREMATVTLYDQSNSTQIPDWLKVTQKISNSVVTDSYVWGTWDPVKGSNTTIGTARPRNRFWRYESYDKELSFLELLDYAGGGIESGENNPVVVAPLVLYHAAYDFQGFAPVEASGIGIGAAKYIGPVTWEQR